MKNMEERIVKPKVYKCPFCPMEYYFAQDLVNHLLYVEKVPPSQIKETIEKQHSLHDQQTTFPIEEYPEKQRQRIIGWIEAEGSFVPMLWRYELIENYKLPLKERVYKHNYLRPFFSLMMTDRIPVEMVREAFNMIGVYEYTRPAVPLHRYKKVYATHLMRATDILGMAEWILPELTPNTTRYTQVKNMLTIFSKEKPSIRLTKEQARIIYPIRREERWKTLIEWKEREELHYARKLER